MFMYLKLYSDLVIVFVHILIHLGTNVYTCNYNCYNLVLYSCL